ncbi:OmpH family outer membrane protein [Haloferula sp.]|uniref:OmpH family outer membrane protein n=1 Tax=Haloferula sp. TaxID=2497595 RepID=UPI00329EB4B6
MLRHAVPIILAALIGVAAANPKVAVVRVAEIHRSLDSTKEQEIAIKAERDAVARDARLRAYHSVLKELEGISKKLKEALADTANPDQAVRENLKRDYSLKLQEASTLHREYESFRSERLRQINAKMVSQMEASLANIHATAAEVGKKKGVDWVFDSSGYTNTGVPFVLYAKNPLDLTTDVLSALGQTTIETAADTSR